jgi:hypothetical protein
MSSALAYYRPGAALAISRPWRRASRIYLVHLLLFTVMAMFGALLSGRFAQTTIAQDMAGFLDEPFRLATQAILLVYIPGNLDILPMYVVLLLLVPFVFVLHDRFRLPLLTFSVFVWLAAGLGHVNLSNHAQESGHWYFDPLSWQLIFTIGVFLGIRMKTGLSPLPYHRAIFLMAAIFAILAVPINLAVYEGWLVPPFPDLYRDLVSKTNSGPLRLVNAVAILYLAWNIEAFRRVASKPWLSVIRMTGRHSLPVFSVGILLSAGASVYMDVHPQATFASQIMILIAGCVLHLLLGWAMEQRRRRAAERAGPPHVMGRDPLEI